MIIAIPIFIIILIFLFIKDNRDFTAFGVSFAELLYIFAVIIMVLIIFSLFNWRCPACGRYLGRAVNPKFCSRCGAKLQ
jgi:rubrerythrin